MLETEMAGTEMPLDSALDLDGLDSETRKLIQEAVRRGLSVPLGPQPERADFLAFCRACYSGYEVAPHLIKLAGMLEQVARGNIRRLLVSMPPRHGKSTTTSILFPAWLLGLNPDRRVVLTSYSADLAQRFSRQVREVVTSEEYRRVYPGVGLSPDSRSVEAWDIGGRRGGLKAVGVGGPLTGHGADVLIIDDPIKNAEESGSATVRQSVWDWFVTTAFTRLEPGGSIVVCAARWHEEDLTGRLLAAEAAAEKAGDAGERWEVLHLPALDDQGRALWPERYDAGALAQIRATLGSRDWEALYQGRPQPPGGGLIRRSYFRTLAASDAPPLAGSVIGVDLAVSAKSTADFTVAFPLGWDARMNYYLFRPARGQWEPGHAREEIIARVKTFGRAHTVGVESVASQIGYVTELRREQGMAGYVVRDIPRHGDKVALSAGWLPIAEQGRLWLVEDGTGWTETFLRECETFPTGRHDDQVDAVGLAFATARTMTGQSQGPIVGGTRPLVSEWEQVRGRIAGRLPGPSYKLPGPSYNPFGPENPGSGGRPFGPPVK